VCVGVLSRVLCHGVALAWRTSPNEIEDGKIKGWPERVTLHEAERIARLRPNIDTNHVKPSPVQPHASTASTAK